MKPTRIIGLLLITLSLVLLCSHRANAQVGTLVPGSEATPTTVTALPAGFLGRLAYVSDGSTATDCTVGSGANKVLCVYDGSAWVYAASGAAGASANMALSNLASVAINTSLLPGADNSINLGSASKQWAAASVLAIANLTTNGIVRVGGGIGTLSSAEISGDGTTSGSNALTLATVNGNVGSFGSATQSLTVTYDGKGRATAVSAQTVTPAFSSLTGTPTTLAGYGITNGTLNTVVPNTLPSAGQILVGNAGGTAYAPVAMSSDATLASTGAITIAANAITLSKLATQATNTVLGNATSGTAVPTALAVGTCSTAGSALIWTTNTGFGCNTSITAAAAPVSGLTGAGTGVLTFLATPSSANFFAAITDETGSGLAVGATAPTFTTSITDPVVIGGTGASSTLELRSTSGSGTTDAVKFTVHTNGGTEAGRFTTSGGLNVGATSDIAAGTISALTAYQIGGTTVLNTNTLGSGVLTSSLTAVGTIGTGVWQGTVINSTYGGMGVNNAGRTLTLNTNSGTIAFSGASKTVTFGNTITFNGTDSTTMTFPSTNATVARTDAANTFTGIQTFSTAIAVASGGTNCSSATITCFNNITGFSAAGTTGTTSTNLVFSTSATLASLTTTGTTNTADVVATSASATALAVGRLGSTTPALLVDASTATSITGIKIKSAATGGGVAISAIGEASNGNLTLDAQGTGTITLGGTSTGAITLTRATTMSAALTYGGVTLSNAVSGTGNMALTAGTTFTGTTATATLTATTLNGNTFTAGTYTLTGTAAKTLTFNNSITLAGTDATTMTFPSTTQTIPGMNQVNTAGSSFTLDMSAAGATAGHKVPVAAGAAPTANGALSYDSTANGYVGGVNGTKNFLAMATQLVTFTGPTAARAYALPDAATTILTTNAAVTVGQGGTGLATLTSNAIYKGNGASNIAVSSMTDDGTTLTSTNTNAKMSAVNPVWQLHDTGGSTNTADAFLGTFDSGGGTTYNAWSSNRNPSSGVFTNTSRAGAQIQMQATANSAIIVFQTSNANNTTPTTMMTIGNAGTITWTSGLTNSAGTPGSLCYNTGTFEMTKNNALTCTVSNPMFKDSIIDLPQTSAFDRLRPVQFVYKDHLDRERWGFLSTEAAKADRRLADGYDATGNPMSIDQNGILALTVKEVQELKKTVQFGNPNEKFYADLIVERDKQRTELTQLQAEVALLKHSPMGQVICPPLPTLVSSRQNRSGSGVLAICMMNGQTVTVSGVPVRKQIAAWREERNDLTTQRKNERRRIRRYARSLTVKGN